MNHALIIQGGGFRTAFSAGVLDAFLKNNYRPFDFYAAVSGGAIAASYFISNQPRHCFESIRFLAEKGRFINYTNVLRKLPIMDVDIFQDISNIHFPFDDASAHTHLKDKKFVIVMTDKSTGEPFYCDPTQSDWREAVIASSSLPFITKGTHTLNGRDYMDGAWGDPLPVEWVAKQGLKEITVVRTAPADEKIGKSWLDFLGEMYYRNNIRLRKTFTHNHDKYNRAIDFINHPSNGIKINQIAPEQQLKAGLYTNSKILLESDYEYGFSSGINYLKKQIPNFPNPCNM